MGLYAFFEIIVKHAEEVDKIFEHLVKQLREVLPDFGQHPSMDSKTISSFAKQTN
ncbi:hypothetical protein SBF1_6960001 [Candidatus Desulfosporosinus infrequens]|uniref:Uncharacterized protein n=1 Tax=Candidatus Desulfosporosinus infrequens TaxID=2043169 RepID=A0A2U3LP47_9FIRM|nr:hypothetical protein SBF1_6960001 [Candidatus Desulfosporosinus infrequens]